MELVAESFQLGNGPCQADGSSCYQPWHFSTCCLSLYSHLPDLGANCELFFYHNTFIICTCNLHSSFLQTNQTCFDGRHWLGFSCSVYFASVKLIHEASFCFDLKPWLYIHHGLPLAVVITVTRWGFWMPACSFLVAHNGWVWSLCTNLGRTDVWTNHLPQKLTRSLSMQRTRLDRVALSL